MRTVTDIADELVDYTIAEILNFDKFTKLFNKTYETLDLENSALLNFLHNQREILSHNEKYKKGLTSFIRGLCEFSDLSAEDMNRIVNKFVKPESERRRKRSLKSKKNSSGKRSKREYPESLNYVEKGYINPVVNQGLCGSCWRYGN